LCCSSALRPPLQRTYKDIDLIGLRSEAKRIDALLVEAGYVPDERFNTMNGHERLLYRDLVNERQLDVFLDRVVMCHTLELRDRLPEGAVTLDPADLLLLKLQVIETNERDLKDSSALLLDCPIDFDRVASVLRDDWGWWRTVTDVLRRVEGYATSVVGLDRRSDLLERIRSLEDTIEVASKSRRWRLRARIGDRVRWYELPEEGG
jgi:hypothetical protein